LSAIAGALPGLGIVAAVLGVVITLQAIGASPETVGQKVATALGDTFLASCCAMA
jgi:chemotaxis protein MotA